MGLVVGKDVWVLVATVDKSDKPMPFGSLSSMFHKCCKCALTLREISLEVELSGQNTKHL